MYVSFPVLILIVFLPYGIFFFFYLVMVAPKLSINQYSFDPDHFGDLFSEMGSATNGLRSASCDLATVCLAVVDTPSKDMDDFNTQQSRIFDHMIYTIADATQRLGGWSCVRSISTKEGMDFSQCASSSHIILFGAHLLKLYLPVVIKVPPKVIIYNMMKIDNHDERDVVSITTTTDLNVMKTHKVWDHSRQNILNLNKMNIHAHYVPVGYSSGLTYRESPAPKKYKRDKKGKKIRIRKPVVVPDIDVLIVGDCTSRRSDIVTALVDKGVGVRLSTSTDQSACRHVPRDNLLPLYFGQHSLDLLRRSHIVLSIYDDDDPGGGTGEMEKITYYLANSKFVIAEKRSHGGDGDGDGDRQSDEHGEEDAYELLQGGVVFSSYSSVVDTCVRYLWGEAASGSRQSIATKGRQLIAQFDISPHVRCPLFGELVHVATPGRDQDTSPSTSTATSTSTHFLATTVDITTDRMTSFVKEFNPPVCFRVVAILSVNSVTDIGVTSIVIKGLIRQGVDVHLLDRGHAVGSGLMNETRRISAAVQRLQLEHPGQITTERLISSDITSLIARKTLLAEELRADWVIDLAANVLVESPWGPKISLRRALFVADQLDFNLANFGKEVLFHAVGGDVDADVTSQVFQRQSMLHFSVQENNNVNVNADEHHQQFRAWKTYSSLSSCHREKVTHSPDTTARGEHASHASPVHPPPPPPPPHSQGISRSASPEELMPPRPAPRVCPFAFVLRRYPSWSAKRGRNHDKSDNNNDDDEVNSNKSALPPSPPLLLRRAGDNGDLPADLFSSFLPCRESSSSTSTRRASPRSV